MSDFKIYFNFKFQEDLNRFFSTIPDESKFHEDINNKETFSIQFERLTPAFNHLSFLDKKEKEMFAIALFLTVLTDMVCFTYYKTYYSEFRCLTRYPKFIGNCPSGCNYHFHPRDIFFAMNKRGLAKDQQLFFIDTFLEARDIMREETVNFFNHYLTEVSGEAFWDKCQKEFPYG